jgi:hypothetical protein
MSIAFKFVDPSSQAHDGPEGWSAPSLTFIENFNGLGHGMSLAEAMNRKRTLRGRPVIFETRIRNVVQSRGRLWRRPSGRPYCVFA